MPEPNGHHPAILLGAFASPGSTDLSTNLSGNASAMFIAHIDRESLVSLPAFRLALGAVLAASLSACGGGADSGSGVTPAVNGSAATDVSAASAADVSATPSFHVAPVELAEPGTVDADGQEASAHSMPLSVSVSRTAAALSTAGTVPEDMRAALQGQANRARTLSASDSDRVSALAATATATVYTPAQMRAAYGLSLLPAATTANKGAYQGSGQTIYIIDAYHYPNAGADLAYFNKTFGLPTCTSLAIPATSKLPLAAPTAGSGCTFSTVYVKSTTTSSGPTGALTTAVPAVNRGWAAETTLDVQWAHAMAPQARIVLIEAASASLADLMAAVDLANKMGPGIVSMSFGAGEFDYKSMLFWGAPLRSAASAKMSYVAANGDWGSQSIFPAVDEKVVAVGGTRLAWNGAVRTETAWTSTGGATSKYVPVPTYQAGVKKPGDPTASGAKIYRGSADVAFNADPYSGQYVYMTPSSVTGGAGWIAAGGTSIGTPQWAGILAIGNAVRALGAKGPLGQPHTAFYKSLAAQAGTYATTFFDVNSGSNGTCGAMCTSVAGYDLLTGLGSPRAGDLVARLAAY